jgi:predicted nucleic acid-binding protein
VTYLLDTNTLSELRKNKPNPAVARWFEDNDNAGFYVSALVIGEIRNGIERLRDRDAARARALESWLSGVHDEYVDRILPVTAEVADLWGRLNVPPKPPPLVDGLMAATALVHGLTFVTRNVAGVGRTGARVVNPFDG